MANLPHLHTAPTQVAFYDLSSITLPKTRGTQRLADLQNCSRLLTSAIVAHLHPHRLLSAQWRTRLLSAQPSLRYPSAYLRRRRCPEGVENERTRVVGGWGITKQTTLAVENAHGWYVKDGIICRWSEKKKNSVDREHSWDGTKGYMEGGWMYPFEANGSFLWKSSTLPWTCTAYLEEGQSRHATLNYGQAVFNLYSIPVFQNSGHELTRIGTPVASISPFTCPNSHEKRVTSFAQRCE